MSLVQTWINRNWTQSQMENHVQNNIPEPERQEQLFKEIEKHFAQPKKQKQILQTSFDSGENKNQIIKLRVTSDLKAKLKSHGNLSRLIRNFLEDLAYGGKQ